jgi:Lysine methyltransferase
MIDDAKDGFASLHSAYCVLKGHASKTIQQPSMIGLSRAARRRGSLSPDRSVRRRRAHLRPQSPDISLPITTPLLLEYSNFYVSHDGVSRTLYDMDAPPYSVEEIYDLKKAEKTYVLREREDPTLPFVASVSPRVGRCLAKISVQEINQGIETVGTGAMTWEASIAASLYFSSNPHLLHGDVLELGCGLGVFGILNLLGPMLAEDSNQWCFRSITFTDFDEEVLRHCRLNIQSALSAFPGHAVPSIYVSRLDWNDFLEPSGTSVSKKYHTVIANDCAYRYSDVEGICHAVKGLLHEDLSSRIHIFGPYNRAVLHEVIRCLRNDMRMHVATDMIEMNRYRLRPGFDENLRSWQQVDIEQCVITAKSNSTVLHVTVSNAVLDKQRESDLSNID